MDIDSTSPDEKCRKIIVFNHFHLGDQLLNIVLLNKVSQCLRENNIVVYYYCQATLHDQVKEFNLCPEHIIILDLQEAGGKYRFPLESVGDGSLDAPIDMHIGNKKLDIHCFNRGPSRDARGRTIWFFDAFYAQFFNQILQMTSVPATVQDIYYEDPDLLWRHDHLIKPEFQNVDVLVINSKPFSGQYKFKESEWTSFIHVLSDLTVSEQKLKLAVTKHVAASSSTNIIPCTLDENYTVKTIAAISTRAKIIIAINTGPIVGCLNIYTMENVRRFFVFDKTHHYSHPKFRNVLNLDEISIDEMLSLLL